MQILDRPVYQSFYTVAGRLFFIECFDLRLGQLIHNLFSGWLLTPVYSPAQSPDIRVQFSCGHALPEIPPNLRRFEIAEGGQCFTNGVDLHLALRQCLVQLQHDNPITVSVSFEELPRAGDPVPARATTFAVFAALRRFGLFELHSAGLVNPENQKGTLIVGPSGSGKSTLALQLAMDGWPYLSDDEVLLSLFNGEVEALGFRSFFAVNATTASALGIQPANEASKTCFEPDAVVSSRRRLRTLPRLLLFTRLKGGSKSQLIKLTQTETMGRLIRACPWASYDTAIAGANLEVLSRLARQTTGFDLHAGRDVLEPRCASDLLSALEV